MSHVAIEEVYLAGIVVGGVVLGLWTVAWRDLRSKKLAIWAEEQKRQDAYDLEGLRQQHAYEMEEMRRIKPEDMKKPSAIPPVGGYHPQEKMG